MIWPGRGPIGLKKPSSADRSCSIVSGPYLCSSPAQRAADYLSSINRGEVHGCQAEIKSPPPSVSSGFSIQKSPLSPSTSEPSNHYALSSPQGPLLTSGCWIPTLCTSTCPLFTMEHTALGFTQAALGRQVVSHSMNQLPNCFSSLVRPQLMRWSLQEPTCGEGVVAQRAGSCRNP